MDIQVRDRAVTGSMSGEAYRQAARSWLAANLPESFRSDSAAFVSPTLDQSIAWEAAMHRAGLAGITWPSVYGGHERSLREHLIVNQEIGALAMPESANSIGKELAGPIILAIGTEAQKLRFLPRILDMTNVWCQGFSEPEAGSDLAGLRTRAGREGNVWRINGQKIWTSGAYRAQRCLLLARTGSLEDRHRGLALFAVPLDATGVRVRTIKSIDGKDNFCEVFFDNVEVAQDDALGAPDEGWAAAIRVLAIERATNRMYRAWRFENELRHLIAASKTDPVLDDLLGERHYASRLAETLVDIDVLKAHVETAVDALVAGESIGARGSLAKLHWSEAHQRFAALAMELLAKASLPLKPAVRVALRRFENIYLGARAETIYAGTTEIQSASSPTASSSSREESDMTTGHGLSPSDFAATATRAVAACTNRSVVEQGVLLAGDGLLGVIAADEAGGLDLPLSFAVPVMSAASAGLLAFPLMENMLLTRMLQRRHLPVAKAIIAGERMATIAWAGSVTAKQQGDRVTLHGWVARAACVADVGLMLVRAGEDAAALVSTVDVRVDESGGLDLGQPESSIELNGVSIAASSLLPEGTWSALEADALVLRAAAILGSAETCLALAQEHVSTRRQFGHALSYNQSIRHILARHKLGLEGIRQSIARALFADSGLRERRSAFVSAATYGAAISEGAVQMHGGMGFTWDVPVHRHMRRVRTLQRQGDASGVLAALGHDYIAAVTPAVA